MNMTGRPMLWPQASLHESRPCNNESAVMRLKFKNLVSSSLIAAVVTAAGFTTLPASVAIAAGDVPLGTATGLPVPRYVSLRAGQVNLRQGPSRNTAHSGSIGAKVCRWKSPRNSKPGARSATPMAPKGGCCIHCYQGAGLPSSLPGTRMGRSKFVSGPTRSRR